MTRPKIFKTLCYFVSAYAPVAASAIMLGIGGCQVESADVADESITMMPSGTVVLYPKSSPFGVGGFSLTLDDIMIGSSRDVDYSYRLPKLPRVSVPVVLYIQVARGSGEELAAGNGSINVCSSATNGRKSSNTTVFESFRVTSSSREQGDLVYSERCRFDQAELSGGRISISLNNVDIAEPVQAKLVLIAGGFK